MKGTRIDELRKLHRTGDPVAAVRVALTSSESTNHLSDVNFICAAILVDRGGDVGDRAAIETGIAAFTPFVADDKASPGAQNSARYNRANGCGALAKHCERANDMEGRLIARQQERDDLQAVLLDGREIAPELLPNILVNFANSLSQLGRKAEALDYYAQALRIAPDHPIALGCAGQVNLDFLGIQPRHNKRLLVEARRCISKALSKPRRLSQVGGPRAQAEYERTLKRIDQLIDGLLPRGVAGLEEYAAKLRATHAGWQPESTISDWIRSRLLLSVNPYPEWCPSTACDDLFFDHLSTQTGEAGLDQFTALAHTLNQIKEDFATARYLYTLSQTANELAPLSKVTQYADTLDYADFGLASGLLKTAIRLEVDSLDKIANFLNRYLNLGINERNVSFATVWYEKGDLNKKIDHAALAHHLAQSGWLRGIRDVAETLNLYPAPMKDIRNKVTHDFLVIENILRPQVRLNGKTLSVDAHEFARQLLVMTKGVIINLTAFVQRNEALSKKGDQTTSVPLEFRLGRGISDQLATTT